MHRFDAVLDGFFEKHGHFDLDVLASETEIACDLFLTKTTTEDGVEKVGEVTTEMLEVRPG